MTLLHLNAGTPQDGYLSADEPHPFQREAATDWGYRPRCRICGREVSSHLHRKVVLDD